jgi:selenocysteine-specific elongation factor
LAERSDERELVLGTAGHIDHGKTALVEALTGRNTDRLAEERRRGITIELGFARMQLPGGRSVSVIDVPGHRRLVRAMVAGASGIDMFLLAVAADDGVMPQTREHLAALRALGVHRGVVAVTKTDAASDETISIAREEAAELVPGAPLVEVSARTGAGVEELRRVLGVLAAELVRAPLEPAEGPVMHLDRVFSLNGVGTVVTGTLTGAPLAAGERIRLLPSERSARIRGIRVHDDPVERAVPGQRVALNLAGVRRDDVARGDVVSDEQTHLGPSFRLDAALDFDPGSTDRRVQVHHGTRHTPARIVDLDGGLAQLRLESPLIARPHDRVVIRRIAPPDTLGGGVVIDADPPRHGPGPAAETLRLVMEGGPNDVLYAVLTARGSLPDDIALWDREPLLGFARRRFGEDRWQEAIASLVRAGALIRADGAMVRPEVERAPRPASQSLDPVAMRLLRELDAGGLQPPAPAALSEVLAITRERAEEALADLRRAGLVTALRGDVNYPVQRLDRVTALVTALVAERGSIGIAGLRDALRISRKYSQAILEHLDAIKVTIRHGDEHFLRRPLEHPPPAGR